MGSDNAPRMKLASNLKNFIAAKRTIGGETNPMIDARYILYDKLT